MAKQVIRLNESDLARMIGEAVKELKKEGKSHKRGEDCRGGNCDGHKTKMTPYHKSTKAPKYTDFDFEDDDVEIVNETSYKKAKSAYDEMKKKGQLNRAGMLNATYNDIKNRNFGASDDDDYYDYNFDDDSLTFASVNEPDGEVTFTRTDIDRVNNNNFRTSNRKLANGRAKALNRMKDPNTTSQYYTKNDFIAEAIKRTIKGYIRRK